VILKLGVTPPRRLQSPTERDLESLAEKKKRESQPAIPVPIDLEDEPLTGRVDMDEDEKALLRTLRDPMDRIASIERWRTESDKRHSELAGAVGRLELGGVRVETKVDTLLQVFGIKAAEDGQTQRTRISVNGKTTAAIISAIVAILIAVFK
jgi:hypothetical protein